MSPLKDILTVLKPDKPFFISNRMRFSKVQEPKFKHILNQISFTNLLLSGKGLKVRLTGFERIQGSIVIPIRIICRNRPHDKAQSAEDKDSN